MPANPGPAESPVTEETFPSNGHRRPTMKEVATLAGVSLATVSRVVNGDGKVRPDLAERVREAVGLLGYRRDLTATNLRRADRSSASVGAGLRRRRQPVPRRGAARGRDGGPHARRAAARRQLRRGRRARARAGGGLPVAPRRRADRRARRQRPLVPARRARCGRGARVRRPPAELHRRRLRALRQRGRRVRGHRAPDRGAATGGSPSSATRSGSSRPPSACAATARRWPTTASPTTPRSCGWGCTTARQRRRRSPICSQRPPRRPRSSARRT